jgi:hypothetical protein
MVFSEYHWPKGNNYIVYRGDKTRDFDLKLQMKIEKGGGGGIQYRSVTGVPWTRPPPAGQPPYDLKFMMTGPQADFWFPVRAQAAAYTGLPSSVSPTMTPSSTRQMLVSASHPVKLLPSKICL